MLKFSTRAWLLPAGAGFCGKLMVAPAGSPVAAKVKPPDPKQSPMFSVRLGLALGEAVTVGGAVNWRSCTVGNEIGAVGYE